MSRRRPTQPRGKRTALTSQRQTQSANFQQQGTLSSLMTSIQSNELLTIVYANTRVQPAPLDLVDFVGRCVMQRLQGLLKRYEKWRFQELTFEYVPTVSKTTPGVVHLAFDHDPSDPPPAVDNAQYEMSTFVEYVSTAASDTCRLVVKNPKIDGEYLYDRLFTGPRNEARFTSHGTLFSYVTGTGLSATDEVGRIILHYKIRLYVPQLEIDDVADCSYIDNLTVVQANETDLQMSCNKYLGAGQPQLKFQNSSVPMVIGTNVVVRAIFDSLTGAAQIYDKQGALARGTELFMRAVQRADTDAPYADNSIVGEIFTNRSMTELNKVGWKGNSGDKINLSDVYHLHY